MSFCKSVKNRIESGKKYIQVRRTCFSFIHLSGSRVLYKFSCQHANLINFFSSPFFCLRCFFQYLCSYFFFQMPFRPKKNQMMRTSVFRLFLHNFYLQKLMDIMLTVDFVLFLSRSAHVLQYIFVYSGYTLDIIGVQRNTTTMCTLYIIYYYYILLPRCTR